MSDSPLVGGVIVNWNRRDLVLQAVRSLKSEGWAPLHIIVVDNGSRDGSAEALREQHQDVQVIRNRFNVGFGRANNQGIAAALAAGAAYVFLLNNDAVVLPGGLTELVRVLESTPEAGAASPFILYADRPERVWFGGGSVALWRGWVGHRRLRRTFTPERTAAEFTEYLTGCAVLLRREVLERVGWFDERFVLYGEDVDLSLRIRKAGWKLAVTPNATVRHLVSGSSAGELSSFKAFHRARSSAMLARKHLPRWQLPTAMGLGWMTLTLLALRAAFKGNPSALVGTVMGFGSGLRGGVIPEEYRLPE